MAGERVSVVIPARNAERYLGEAIDSVLAQSHAALEVIVVDDGSSDGTAAVASRYGPPVTVVREAGVGAGAARNRGAGVACGDFLAFLDADDVWTSDKLARQLAVFRDAPAAEIVLGHVRQFTGRLADGFARGAQSAYVPGVALVRMDVWSRVGPLPSDVRVGEFMDWLLRARERGVRMAMLDEHVLWRRVHDTNLMLAAGGDLRDYARIVKRSLDRRRANAQT